MELQGFFHEHPKAALGFSGGVDSSYLLWAARQCGADVRPYYIKTAFQPEFEFEDAKRLCREIGAELTVLELDARCARKIAHAEVAEAEREKQRLSALRFLQLFRRDGLAGGYARGETGIGRLVPREQASFARKCADARLRQPALTQR